MYNRGIKNRFSKEATNEIINLERRQASRQRSSAFYFVPIQGEFQINTGPNVYMYKKKYNKNRGRASREINQTWAMVVKMYRVPRTRGGYNKEGGTHTRTGSEERWDRASEGQKRWAHETPHSGRNGVEDA